MGASFKSGGKSKPGLTPNINVTPLVDVVLVLLIIFMVVIPNVQDGKPIEMLEVVDADETPSDAEPIVVTIDAQQVFSLETDDLARNVVIASVRSMHTAEPRRPILVRGDSAVPYRVVRDFFSELQQAGVANIKLAVGKAREWNPEDGTQPEGS